MIVILLGIIFHIFALYPTDRSDSACLRDGEAASRRMKTEQQDKNSGKEHYARANAFDGWPDPQASLREYKLAIEKGYDTVELRIQLGRLLAFGLDQPGEAVAH